MMNSDYKNRIKSRTILRFIFGLLPRLQKFVKYSIICSIAILRGAKVGKNVVIPLKLALRANKNLVIGENSSIQSDKLDLRSSVVIGSNVIIGKNVEIITESHNIDSQNWEQLKYGIKIDDFVWISTNALILPTCQQIEYGAVCGASSVVSKNVEKMQVVVGNPAKVIRQRKNTHNLIHTEALLGNDLLNYIKTYFDR